ncbi:hypothetical protein KUCAC02_002566, partial [Chaenocephalus aceratus]
HSLPELRNQRRALNPEPSLVLASVMGPGDVIVTKRPGELKYDRPKPLLVKPIDPHSHTATPKTKPVSSPLPLSPRVRDKAECSAMFIPSGVSALWIRKIYVLLSA